MAGREQVIYKAISWCGLSGDGNGATVEVKDGKVIRIRPLRYDEKYQPEIYKPWKIEARGKTFEPCRQTLLPPLSYSYKKRVYSPNRLLYPIKRVDFDPNGERNIQNRGKSKFVRISWDEALDIIVSELKRIKEKYGPFAIFSQADGHGEAKIVHATHGCHRQLLRLLGGYTAQTRNPDSWEGWYWGAKHVWGCEPHGQMMPMNNVIKDTAEHCELILGWGCDPETTGWGWAGQIASRLLFWFTELGIKQIYICPDLSYSAAIHADKWIPILPNTDAALQLAIAYTWIIEGTYKKEFLATHAIRFEVFRDYVLGKEDGVPKTPKWAEPLCGVPARIIKALARDWASKKTSIAHGNGGGFIRGPYSTEPARLQAILLSMQGLGAPGAAQLKMMEWSYFDRLDTMQLPRAVHIPRLGKASHGWYVEGGPTNLAKQIITKTLVIKALLNDINDGPPIEWYGNTLSRADRTDQFKKYQYPVEGFPRVRMIWTDTPCSTTCWNEGNKLVEAFRSPKIEFILAQQPWLENDCLLADIVLPVSTKFEEEDISTDCMGGQYVVMMHENQCIEPLGESKSDYEITQMIAERMGLLKELTQGRTVQDDIRVGFETSGMPEFLSYDEWLKKGYYVIPTDPEWQKYPVGLRNFYNDPKSQPLSTPTGKIEFYSQKLAESFPGDKERPPSPKWVPYGEYHQESRLCERAKTYPLLMVSNHPRWGIHANHSDVTWLREIPTCKIKGPDGYLYQPVWLNPSDAASRGIQHGDIVKVYNERGATLCGAFVTERMIAGAVSSDHGAKYDPLVPGELDRGGANNLISPYNIISKNASGMVSSGFLVEIEKVNLDKLRKMYPEAFSRPFHPTAGPIADSFIIKGK